MSRFWQKTRAKIYYVSALGDSDDLPEDVDDVDRYIEISHKNDLDLGIELVREFVSQRLPNHANRVEGTSSRKGAYARFKALLESKGLIDEWH